MDGLHDAGKKEILEGHQACNGEKGVDRRRPLDKGMAARLKLEYEAIKLTADEEGEEEKAELYGIPHSSDVRTLLTHACMIIRLLSLQV
jgi:hypothetical protein